MAAEGIPPTGSPDSRHPADTNAGTECLHFIRRVEAAAPDSPVQLSAHFTEDMWFARGKGLVRLEQRVDDKLTMTWQLVNFTPGAH